MLITLAVGIAAAQGAEEDVCSLILGIVAVAANVMFLVVLNPLKFLSSIAIAVQESRIAAKVAAWDEEAIKKLSKEEVAEITAQTVASLSDAQVFYLLRLHGSILESDVLGCKTELDLNSARLEGASQLVCSRSELRSESRVTWHHQIYRAQKQI